MGERTQRTQSIGVLIYNGDSVLLVKHTKDAKLPEGIYGFPAGKVEAFETKEAACVRELFEETGLVTTTESLEILEEKDSEMTMSDGGKKQFVFTLFHCTSYSGDLVSSNKTIPEFVPIDSLKNYFTIEDVEEVVQKYWHLA